MAIKALLKLKANNSFLQAQTAYIVSAKDFRIWRGTRLAFERMYKAAQQGKFDLPLNHFIGPVAECLGNTPTIAQQFYFHSDLMALWQENEFQAEVKPLIAIQGKLHFSRSEAMLKQLLENLQFKRFLASLKIPAQSIFPSQKPTGIPQEAA